VPATEQRPFTTPGAALHEEREDTAVADRSVPKLTRDEALERSVTIVRELVRRMGFTAEVEGEIDEKEDEIVVRVRADAEGLLIGRRGQTLDAAEHLVNRMVFTGEAGNESRIALDVGGYRERRRDALYELAARLKERAVAQGRRVQVSPMSPRDRRILQEALGADASIEARVLGSGFYRRVLICPVGLADDSAPIDELPDETPDAAGGGAQQGGS
jgi:spoIIIJ-associated protein